MEPDRSKIRKSALIFFFFFVATILYLLLMRRLSWPLNSTDIVNLEIARTIPMAKFLLNEFAGYSPSKLEKASTSVYLDFGFIIFYAGLIISATRFLGHLSGNDLIERASRFFLFIAIAAGIADLIENLLLLQTIGGHFTELGIRMTYNMAVAKFSMIIISVMFIGIELVYVAGAMFGRREKAWASK